MAYKNLNIPQDIAASPLHGTEQASAPSAFPSSFTFKCESPLTTGSTTAVASGSSGDEYRSTLDFEGCRRTVKSGTERQGSHAPSRPLSQTGRYLRSMAKLSENRRRSRSKYGYPLRVMRYTPSRHCATSFNVRPVGNGEGEDTCGDIEEEEYSGDEDDASDEEEDEEDGSADDKEGEGGKRPFDINVAQELLGKLAAARPDVSNILGV